MGILLRPLRFTNFCSKLTLCQKICIFEVLTQKHYLVQMHSMSTLAIFSKRKNLKLPSLRERPLLPRGISVMLLISSTKCFNFLSFRAACKPIHSTPFYAKFWCILAEDAVWTHRGTDICQWVFTTNLRNVPKNVCGHKSLRFSTSCKIRTISGVQTLMDLQ